MNIQIRGTFSRNWNRQTWQRNLS